MARKAPLVASDSSSSNSSDSDDEEAKKDPSSGQTVTTETVSTVAGKETIRLTVDTKNERAVFSSDAAKVPAEGINVKDGEKEKKKEHGDEPSPASASLSTQPAALTQ